MKLILTNVLIFTNDASNTVLHNQAVVIEGIEIVEVGPESRLVARYPKHKNVDGNGRLLMPGLINAHTHFYSTFARGLALKKTPDNFHEILKNLWWKLDSALDLKSVYYSALVQIISAVKHGVTAVIDHHASSNAIDGSLDMVEEALALLGLRGVLCYEISDRDGEEKRRHALAENERYIRKCQTGRAATPGYLFDAMVGLHASFTLEAKSLQNAGELARSLNRGCHIHLLEDAADRRLTRKRFDENVVQRLVEYGILSSRSIAAHGVHLNDSDLEMLAPTGTSVVHNPQSNMNNAVGRADIFLMREHGILLGLGSDGMNAGIVPDACAANLIHKHDLRNSNVAWNEVAEMLLKNNPGIYRRLTGQKVGEINKGYLADLILVDYWPPTPMRSDNFWGHFLFGIAHAPVNTTIVNGTIIMHDKKIAGLDEEEIAAHARECAEGVWRRF